MNPDLSSWQQSFHESEASFRPVSRFSQFETIDWIEDSLTENRRRLAEISEIRHVEQENTTNDAISYHTKRFKAAFTKLKASGQGWLVLTLMGITIGLIAGSLNILTAWLGDLRTGRCSAGFYLNKTFCCWGEDESHCDLWNPWTNVAFANYLLFIIISVGLAALSGVIVKYYAPFAAGSGISEIKCIVSGFVMDGFLSGWTLLVKSIGLPLAIASGLSVGKEGPSVHYAVCVGNVIPPLFKRSRRSSLNARHFLTAASAAGVAVAFGSPMGGVLFSVEEISSIFQLSTMWRSYYCSLVAIGVLSVMNPFRTGQLVMFELRYDQDWHLFELLFFALLGVFGGVYGIVVSKFNIYVVAFRQKFLRNHGLREVLVLASFTSMICYFNDFLRLDMTESMEILFDECKDGGNAICSADKNWLKFVVSLGFATIFRMVLTIITYGCKVPAGIFVPSMAAGATFGRAVGIIVKVAYKRFPDFFLFKSCNGDENCIVPGTYAFLGAGSALSGITHLTVTVAVIMFELTGAVKYIIPTMIAVGFTKAINDRWGKGGIADQMIRFNGMPFIDGKEEHVFNCKTSNAMSLKVVCLPARGLSLGDLRTVLEQETYKVFPVVLSLEESDIPLGLVHRADLLREVHSSNNLDELCSFASCSRLKKLGFKIDQAASSLNLEHLVNFSPITVDINLPLELTLEVFFKLGPKLVLVTDNGLLAGILTRKDTIKYEIYLHRSHENYEKIGLVGQKVWRFLCWIDDRVLYYKAKLLGHRYVELGT